jgi:deoxycytidylate deaminase
MTEKITYVCDVPCPNCQCIVIIKKRTKIIVPAEPAEKEETYYAEKGVQLTLDPKPEANKK